MNAGERAHLFYGSELASNPIGRARGLYKGRVENLAPYGAEFIGSFLLTITYMCNLTGDRSWAVTCNALAAIALIAGLGHLSGANLNPSISISLFLTGRKTGTTTIRFCIVQIIGAACAALCVRFMLKQDFKILIAPKDGYSTLDAMVVEVLFTGMICFVFLNCIASPKNNPGRDQNGFGALATGFCFIAGGHVSKEISGSVMNPAIAFGLQIGDLGRKGWTGWPAMYLLWEIFGAFLAAGGNRIVRPGELVDLPGLAANARKEFPAGSRVMAEFIGTFYVILTKVMVHNRLSTAEPWAVAAVMMSMVYSLRGVSGAYFNPAVTLSAAVSHLWGCDSQSLKVSAQSPDLINRVVLFRLGSYVGAQIFGALFATSACAMLTNVKPPELTSSFGSVVLAESLFTSLVCYVFLATSLPTPSASSPTAHNNVAGLAVAGSYLVSHVAVDKVSGCVLNPAIALGLSGLQGLTGHKKVCLPYIFYEMFGAVVASVAFYLTHSHMYPKVLAESDASTIQQTPADALVRSVGAA